MEKNPEVLETLTAACPKHPDMNMEKFLKICQYYHLDTTGGTFICFICVTEMYASNPELFRRRLLSSRNDPSDSDKPYLPSDKLKDNEKLRVPEQSNPLKQLTETSVKDNSYENRNLAEKIKRNPKIYYIKIPFIENAYTQSFDHLFVSLDGKWIVMAGSNYINVWSLQTRSLYYSFQQVHMSGISSLDLSRDGNQILSTSNWKEMAIWSIPEKQSLLWVDKAHKKGKDISDYVGHLWAAKFSPNDQLVASFSRKEIKIWQRSDLCLLSKLRDAHEKDITGLVFHPNARYLLTIGLDQKMRCWDIKKKLNCVFVIRADSSTVSNTIIPPQFDTTGRKFVSTGSNGSINVWNFRSRMIIDRISYANKDVVIGMCSVSSDFEILCAYGTDNKMKIWNLENSKHPILLHTFSNMKNGHVENCIGLTQKGNYIVGKSDEDEIAIFEF